MRTADIGGNPGMGRRAGWGVADQLVSSGTNYAANVVVLRALGVEAFGAFSLAFFLYLFVISVTRAYPMEPLAIRYPLRSDQDWRRGAAAALGTVVIAGVAGSIVSVIVGLLVGDVVGGALIGMGVTMTGLVLQDGIRMMFFSRGQADRAFQNDLFWAVALIPCLGLAVVLGGDVVVITIAWGIAGTGAALFGLWQSRVVPRPRLAGWWWGEHRDIGSRFLAEASLRTALVQLTFVGISLIAGIAAVGYIRGGQLLMAPVQVLFLGLTPVLVPEGVRSLERGIRSLTRLAVAVSLGEVAMAVGWGAVVTIGFATIGPILLGDEWASFRAFLPAAIGVQLATVATAGAQMTLRALGDAGRSLRATIVGSVTGVILPVAASSAGPVPAAWGLAVATAVGAIAWWALSRRGALAWVERAAVSDAGLTRTTPGLT
jgi:O-antigen/teichoic acid export membrane protein